jgi:hypothetical protein
MVLEKMIESSAELDCNVMYVQVGSVSTALPMTLESESNFVDMVQDLEDTLPWLSLTPHCPNQTNPYMQSVVVRGIPENMPRR